MNDGTAADPAGTRSRSARRSSQVGSGWYVFSYVGGSLRSHKTRSASLLLGIIIGVALVASIFVWTDTGTRIAIDDYFADNLFQLSVVQRYEYPVDPLRIYAVKGWVDQSDLTEASFVVHATIGILNATEMDDNHPYLPYPYQNGIKDAKVFLVDNDFLSLVQRQFNITGSFSVEPGVCLVSQRVIEDAEQILGLKLGVGSYIDLALALRYQEPTTLGDLNRLNITHLRIAGIYSLPAADTVLHNAFPSTSRANYQGQGNEPVFGWNDGIILHRNQLTEDQRNTITINGQYPKLLVRLSPAAVLGAGLDRVVPVIDSFMAQLEVEFQGKVSVGGERQLIYLSQYIMAYQSRRSMGVLVAPVTILSVFLTTFATNIFLSGRRGEVAILRARGASFRQLYAAFILEFALLGVIGGAIGIGLSLFLGCLIPAATGFLQFDMAEFLRFFAVVRLQPFTWIFAGIVCLAPPLVYTLIYVRSFLRTEIYQAMVGINPPRETEIGVLILYLIGCIAFLVLFVMAVLWLPSTPGVAMLQFIYAVGLWVVLCDSGSRVMRRGVAGLSRLLRPLFGEKTFIFTRSMRARRERIIPLLIILTLTFSVTVYSVVEAQTVIANAQRQVEYFIGADLRVESGYVPASRVNELAAIPGIAAATVMVKTTGIIGPKAFALIGVDVASYSTVGVWDPTSMVGEHYSVVLSRLASDPDGIIFPSTYAEKLMKTVGDGVGIQVYDQSGIQVDDHVFHIVGLGHSAPGLGYFDQEDPTRPPDITSGFQFQETMLYALVRLDYLQGLNITNAQLFLASLEPGADVKTVIQEIRGLSFVTDIWSPHTFSLEEAYPEGYLFNRGVISLLSIGFLACLAISMVALTVFVGVIVAERQTEYAIMRAVGGSRRQIVAIVIGEFVGLILASFFVSIFLGVGFSWLLMNVLLNLFPFPYVVPFPIQWPLDMLILFLALVLAGMVVGTYVPARRAGRTNVGRVLRNL